MPVLLPMVWEPQRLFCQEAERLHEYFIREAMCRPRNIWQDSPGSWEPVQEVGL